MANAIDESLRMNPPLKAHKLVFITQILLRILAVASTLAGAWIVLTSNQTAVVYGIKVEARYSYSPAFKFLAYADVVACAFTVLSLIVACVLGAKAVNPTYYFYMFLHDLIMTILLMAGCAAGTAVGYIGKYGNSHSGWMAICDNFVRFCNRITVAAALSYFGFIFYLILTVISANVSRQIHV